MQTLFGIKSECYPVCVVFAGVCSCGHNNSERGSLNKRHSLSASWRLEPKIQGSQGRFLPRRSPSPHRVVPLCVCVCVLISSSYKDPGHIGLQLTLMVPFTLISSLTTLSPNTVILRVRTSTFDFWGHNSACNRALGKVEKVGFWGISGLFSKVPTGAKPAARKLPGWGRTHRTAERSFLRGWRVKGPSPAA